MTQEMWNPGYSTILIMPVPVNRPLGKSCKNPMKRELTLGSQVIIIFRGDSAQVH